MGYEQFERAGVYFLVDDTNNATIIINYDKPNDARHGGEAALEITSSGLEGLPMAETHLVDDGGEFGFWDCSTGTLSTAYNFWDHNRTDGGVIGYLPPKDFCITMKWWFLKGISGVVAASFDSSDNSLLFPVEVPAELAMKGIEFCAFACTDYCSAYFC